MATKITPMRLDDAHLHLLDRLMEHGQLASRTEALRLAIEEAATMRGINNNTIMYTNDHGDSYPLEVAVPGTAFEVAMHRAHIERVLAGWSGYVVKIADAPEGGWWAITITQDTTDFWALTEQPSAAGRVCILNRQDTPLVWVELPTLDYRNDARYPVPSIVFEQAQ